MTPFRTTDPTSHKYIDAKTSNGYGIDVAIM